MLSFPPLRSGSWTFTSRRTVDGDRPTPQAMARIDRPAVGPRGITSRSSRERRSSERSRSVGLLPPWEPEDPAFLAGCNLSRLAAELFGDRPGAGCGVTGAGRAPEQVALFRSPVHGG